MQDLQVFQNSKFGNLEVLTIDGKEWFPAVKVAEVLSYTNPYDAINRHTKQRGVVKHEVIDSLGRKQLKKFIDEGNLYRLITKSKLPQAEQFEEWVFEEVLPSIRKNGTYQVPQNSMEALELMFQATKETKKEVDSIKSDVIDLKENQRLDPGEYNYLSSVISKRVNFIKNQFSLLNSRKVNSELYKDINTEVKRMTGVQTRSQLKQKHFDDVLDMINNWMPAQSTLYVIKQQNFDLEKSF
ncbi:phage repressor protein [Staphylococcus xylosus]|uniref:BRO family protein n=1 Tax=Staphylococcus xylosus TaxID=1288 RepID=UPI000D1D43CA|nr:BRO family protein [Staphylococcus xylosus]PTH92913.1 phage repressor protein [Staphylococcus xylosus]